MVLKIFFILVFFFTNLPSLEAKNSKDVSEASAPAAQQPQQGSMQWFMQLKDMLH